MNKEEIERGVRMKMEDYNKYYIQGTNHYLIPKDVFIELFNEMENWREEAINYKETKQKDLQNRIDKAIEYIEMFDIEHLHEICEHNLVDTLEVLLDILKESGD